MHGHYSEGRGWLEEALKRAGSAPAAERAKALHGFGWLLYRTGETDRAVGAGEEGLGLSNQAGLGGAAAADHLRLLGWMAWAKGEYERAKDLLEESLTLSRDTDDRFGVADSLLMLGSVVGSLGDRERDRQLHEEGVALCRELGYTSTLAILLFSKGYGLLVYEGEYARGEALIEEAAALYRERGYKGGLQYALDNLGWAALLQGDYGRAWNHYRESLTMCKDLGDKMVASFSLGGLACISAIEGNAKRAARLFGAAEAFLEAVGSQLEPEEDALRQPYLAAARSRLDEATWQAEWLQGRAMSMERAIDYALSGEKPTSPSPEGSPAGESPELTSREREVATLVAGGLTNRQISQELVLSNHTVDKHVKNIFKKLGLRSREQVASRLRGQ